MSVIYCIIIRKNGCTCSFDKKIEISNKLKNNGPKIEPSGTSLIISYQSLKEELFLFFLYDLIGSYLLN